MVSHTKLLRIMFFFGTLISIKASIVQFWLVCRSEKCISCAIYCFIWNWMGFILRIMLLTCIKTFTWAIRKISTEIYLGVNQSKSFISIYLRINKYSAHVSYFHYFQHLKGIGLFYKSLSIFLYRFWINDFNYSIELLIILLSDHTKVC